MSFRAKDVSPDLDAPFVCWRLWSGLVQLWRNSVRASAKTLTFLVLLSFSSAGCLASSPTTQLSTIHVSRLYMQICFFALFNLRTRVGVRPLWPTLTLPSQDYFHRTPTMSIFLKAPPNEFLQILPLTFGPFQPSFLDNPARINDGHQLFSSVLPWFNLTLHFPQLWFLFSANKLFSFHQRGGGIERGVSLN